MEGVFSGDYVQIVTDAEGDVVYRGNIRLTTGSEITYSSGSDDSITYNW